MYFYKILSALIILLSTFCANAQEIDKDKDIQSKNVGWISYRDAYKEMLWFEKFGGQKNLIQSNLHIQYQDTSIKLIKPRLKLQGKTINLTLPLDAMNRTSLPLIKTAYDENAELILSSFPDQHISNVKFQNRISLQLRNDGIYEVTDLIMACSQALQFQNYMNISVGKKKECVGVKFLFSETDTSTTVKLKTDQMTEKNLPIIPMTESTPIFEYGFVKLKAVNLFFNRTAQKAQVFTKTTPIAIIPLIE